MNKWQKRAKSFQYAVRGIFYVFQSQVNAKIHLALGCLVIIFAFLLKVSVLEWLFLIFSIGFVFTLETLNTALEELVNFISPEYHQKAGIIKDIAAGAVLITAFTTFCIGNVIFLPKIWYMLF